jgi:hypothetical protein
MDELNYIKQKIEVMDKKDQINILKLFKESSSVILNENQNGTFINITELDKKIKTELKKYINYVDVQKNILEKDEVKKTELEEAFFNNP